MHIEILYFEGCPHVGETVTLVRRIARELDVEVDIDVIEVEDDERARELDFRGSPTVRVDGKDIQPDAQEHTTVGLGCRVYTTPEGTRGVPPADMIEDALRRD
jgi:glutaredoxin